MKHRLLLFLFCCGTIFPASAQMPATGSMVEAEKAFAAFSVKNGTRAAFLANLDSNAVMFSKDSFANGMQLWLGREERVGVLDWRPVVAELANSGDWGFTTGPWTYRKSAKDSISGQGHFFTIWQKKKGAEWKFIFDCGAEGGAEPLEALYSFQSPKRPANAESLVQVDRDFTSKLMLSVAQAHQQYLSVTSVLVRNGQAVAITPGQQSKWMRGLPATIQCSPAGILTSPSNDMALSYGTIQINGKAEPYLRLWRSEPGGWKLAAELLRL